MSRTPVAAIVSNRYGAQAGRWLRGAFLAGQIAVTASLLVGATVITRAIHHATSQGPGFAVQGIEAISIEPHLPRGSPMARWRAFFLGLRDGLSGTSLWPVAVTEVPPFSDENLMMFVQPPGAASGVYRPVLKRPVSANYFAVLRIPIVEGRAPEDDAASRDVVVSQTAASVLWPGRDPIGQQLRDLAVPGDYRVVGVARDVVVRWSPEAEPVVYTMPDWSAATLLVRDSGPDVIRQVRAIATRLEPNVSVTGRAMADYLSDPLMAQVLAARGAWALAVLALALATIGTFAIFAYEVEDRRHEIGILVSLGAHGRDVIGRVFRWAAWALLSGLLGGFALSLAAVPTLRHFLFGLAPFDPMSYIIAATILTATVALASWVPARRALGLDPAKILRYE